jgi:hypothetical protein
MTDKLTALISECKVEIEKINNKYNIYSDSTLLDDYDSPIEQLIRLRAKLQALTQAKTIQDEREKEEIEFLKPLKYCDYEEIKVRVKERIQEIKGDKNE